MSQEISLAPAAGSGIGKLLADALLKSPDFVDEMRDVILRGLRAEMPSRWDPASKQWAEAQPDCRTQIQTLSLVLAHMEGEPIKRIIHQHIGDGKAVDPLAALQESPALRDAARRLLEKSEFRTRHTKKAAETVLDVA